ncbi:MAG TPA: IS110 family transposase [Persephonella sp.]|nr:IS110 family transposase [Persephonella sp.]
MKKIIKQNLGIDVSKKDLAVCLMFLYNDMSKKIKGTRKFDNNETGFKALLEWIERKKEEDLPVHFTLEPTGVYHENVSYFLNDMNQLVHIVLTKKAKRYAESLGTNSKTDKLDSKALAQMGIERELELWQPGSPVFRKLKTLTRERSSMIKIRVMLKNQLEALNNSANRNKKSINRLIRLIKEVNENIARVEKDIEREVENDQVLKSKILKLVTIPGVGYLTAIIIVAETDGFALIKSIKQIVAYAGLDIKIRESGKWKGKSKISKSGNVHIRKALYFPAYTSIRHSQTYKLFYERLLDKRDISLVAAVAVQRKILGLIYTLWKNDSIYIENYKVRKVA